MMSSSKSVKKVSTAYLFFKRLFDIISSLIGIAILIPATVIIKLAFMLSGDFYSIFYSQERIKKGGGTFKMFKFRSMIPHADEKLAEILAKDPVLKAEYDEFKKLKNDPRITKVGKFLRFSSLDELPQVINIFTGDMSVVGNRPYLPREAQDMGEYHEKIIRTKPGLTGLWQTSGRNDIPFHQRLEIEAYYSENISFKMDTKIFFKTFASLFKGN